MCYYHLLCNVWFLLYRIYSALCMVMYDYVMLCNSVCTFVITWLLCALPMFMYMVTLYQML